MDELQKELGEQNAALAKVMEASMAKYFGDADEKAEARFNRLEKRIDNMNATLLKHTEEIRNIRVDSESLQERTAHLEESFISCLEKLKICEDKLTEMEDRARRDNVLIFNLKEGSEGGNARAYLSQKLVEWFPALKDSPPELMRVHRLGQLSTSGPKTARPRPLIAKCLRFTDRDLILKEARNGSPEVEGSLLNFTADYSEATTKRRKPCYKIMHEARKFGFRAFLNYPAIIQLSKLFNSRVKMSLIASRSYVRLKGL